MNREDIKYVRKIDVSMNPSKYPDYVVQVSSDNVIWDDLVMDIDEWLIDLIVSALTPTSLTDVLLPENDITIDEDDEVELDPQVIRDRCGYPW